MIEKIRGWFRRQRRLRFDVKTASELLEENIALTAENNRLNRALMQLAYGAVSAIDGHDINVLKHSLLPREGGG